MQSSTFVAQILFRMILIGSGLAFFFCILLLTKKDSSKADYLLSSWMLLIALHLLLFYVNNNNLYKQFPHLIGIDIAFPIFQVLCLFFYVRMISTNQQRFYKTDILHLLSSIAAYVYMIPFFMKPGADKYRYFQNIGENEKHFIGIITLVMILSGIVYISLSIRMINKYKKYIGQHYSFVERINLNWLRRLIYGMTSIWMVILVVKILQSTKVLGILGGEDYWIFLSVSLFIGFLGYYGIRQTTIFSNHSFYKETSNTNKTSSDNERYRKSGLKTEQATHIQKKLTQLMKSKKPYLDNLLSLDALAIELNVRPNHLSQVINEHFSRNFHDFINSFRIEEFKSKITHTNLKNFSILGLAFECGFNSKSAFYSAFKKEVGVSPSEYIKKNP